MTFRSPLQNAIVHAVDCVLRTFHLTTARTTWSSPRVLTLLGPQSRVRNKLLGIILVRPHNGTAVPKRVTVFVTPLGRQREKNKPNG